MISLIPRIRYVTEEVLHSGGLIVFGVCLNRKTMVKG